MSNKKKTRIVEESTKQLSGGITETVKVIREPSITEGSVLPKQFVVKDPDELEDNLVDEPVEGLYQPVELVANMVLVIDRINGFTYVKEDGKKKFYASLQYKVNDPAKPTTALVNADGWELGNLKVELIGKELHQMSDIEMDEYMENKINKASFIVKG